MPQGRAESACAGFRSANCLTRRELLRVGGLCGRTLVIVNAEFGRTPRVNSASGRDHWPWVYSLALAGGGTARGVVYGSSDKIAAFPTSQPHGLKDIAARLYHLLGMPANTIIHDPLRRPNSLVIGQQIDGLLT